MLRGDPFGPPLSLLLFCYLSLIVANFHLTFASAHETSDRGARSLIFLVLLFVRIFLPAEYSKHYRYYSDDDMPERPYVGEPHRQAHILGQDKQDDG